MRKYAPSSTHQPHLGPKCSTETQQNPQLLCSNVTINDGVFHSVEKEAQINSTFEWENLFCKVFFSFRSFNKFVCFTQQTELSYEINKRYAQMTPAFVRVNCAGGAASFAGQNVTVA